MRADIDTIIKFQPSQHSLDWYRVRLGRFTGSQVGRLMKRGRAKADTFSKDGASYIAEVVAEQLLNPAVIQIDEMFEEYLTQTTATSKAMAWGNDQEMNARGLYASKYGFKVTSCGCIQYGKMFGDSPDGLLLDKDGVIEIKCPSNKQHTVYMAQVREGEDLKRVNSEYYWQVMAHLLVTDAAFCDRMSYCPFNSKPLHVARIERDEDAIAQLRERIELAVQIADVMRSALMRGDKFVSDEVL